MVDIRTFWLENEIGKTFSLTSKLDIPNEHGAFLHQPEGLGFSTNNEYLRLGATQYSVSSEVELGQISGELMFRSYNEYLLFQRFISSTSTIKFWQELPYDITNTGLVDTPMAYSIVKLQSISKTEKDNALGVLICNVTFDLTTPWKVPGEVVKLINLEGSSGTKTYEYTYDDDGKTSPVYGTESASSVTLNYLGSAPSYPKLVMTGVVTNPRIIIKDFNTSEVIFEMHIDVSVLAGETLVIDFEPANYKVSKNGSNIFNFVSPEFDTEFMFSGGKYILEVTQSATTDLGTISLEYTTNFWSV